jgi:hypothetical protein
MCLEQDRFDSVEPLLIRRKNYQVILLVAAENGEQLFYAPRLYEIYPEARIICFGFERYREYAKKQGVDNFFSQQRHLESTLRQLGLI